MQLEKLCKKLIIRDPFWGLFLLCLNKRMSTEIDTACVAKSGIGVELLINPEFWETLNDEEQMAVLLHELHHICFGHLFMYGDFPDKFRLGIAADAEVNCYIQNLPKTAIFPKQFGLPERQGLKWYYENLPDNVCTHYVVLNDNEGDSNGSGNGNSDQSTDTLDDHSKWKEFQRATPAQQELIKNQIDGIIKRTAEQTVKQRGTIPAYLQNKIDDLLKERERIYDWKAQFRRMLGTEIECKFRKTYQRESKRFIGAPGIKLKKKIRILVAIDTSGSVSDRELSEFFSEIMHIYRAGASVHIIECDAAISSEWEFTGLKNVTVSGRGGTDFKPAIDYYREHKKEFTGFVFFTDGYAPIDNLDVPNNDMTWVITSNGKRQDYPGKVIYIPASQE